MSRRLHAMGVNKYRNAFSLTIHESVLEDPTKWSKPRLVFVHSMSDLFDESVPEWFIEAVFDVMNQASQHTFQVLTSVCQKTFNTMIIIINHVILTSEDFAGLWHLAAKFAFEP